MPALLTLDMGFSTGSDSCRIYSLLKGGTVPMLTQEGAPASKPPSIPTESSFLK